MKPCSVLAFLGVSLASAHNITQNKPFVLRFTHGGYGGGKNWLVPCHAGANQAGLCPETDRPNDESKSPPSLHEYYLKENGPKFDNQTLGTLVWSQNIGGRLVPSELGFNIQIASNGAIPMFKLGSAGWTGLGFDKKDSLFIHSSRDDSKAKPGTIEEVNKAYYNWFICETFVEDYHYKALVWVTAMSPSNPTCKKAKVYREWVTDV
ncbi:hypothetical protein CCHL11_00555 [Colletotrichum chlorophyti]|uniref:Uncharacterized protein n=1 Tax=Colletotrichum chlorophyti TaxID=708187 RepID=A0A1Q8RUM3_9PEZI|nr:hypothetical protein CCHL11_00555 [Colletotrichum chlorophyti]